MRSKFAIVKEKFFKKVVFLDRDGVINKKIKHDYVKKWSDFEFLPGAINGVKSLNNQGYEIFIVTNQRGIGRGLMTKEDLLGIHTNMLSILRKNSAEIKDVYYCPHNIEEKCYCRKPEPGLLLKASSDHHIDLSRSVFIGDSQSDIEAGKRAGCRTILMESNSSLLDAIKFI